MDSEKVSGPFRATKLWNEAISTFREGMPLKKHRVMMRSYEDCFSGTAAVSWLHTALQNNPNFGPEVTREQTVQLLEKIFQAGVFIDIRAKGTEGLDIFKEKGHVYKFIRSPLKSLQLANLVVTGPTSKVAKVKFPSLACSPSVSKSRVLAPPSPSKDAVAQEETKARFLREVHAKAAAKQKQQLEEDEVWRCVVLGRLEALLEGVELETLLPSSAVCGQWILRNVCESELAGGLLPPLSTQLERVRGLPNWIIAAIRMLAEYPASSAPGSNLHLSGYAGFELDVYQEVVKYFSDNEAPLISPSLYSAFTHAFLYLEFAEFIDKLQNAAKNKLLTDYPMSSQSTENLVLGMSSPVKPTNPFLPPSKNPFINYVSPSMSKRHTTPSKTGYDQHYTAELNEAVESFDEILSGSKLLNTVLPPNTCFETAFTSETPTTRIIPQCTVDALHFQGRRSRMQMHDDSNEIYVQMDQFRNVFNTSKLQSFDPTPPKRSTVLNCKHKHSSSQTDFCDELSQIEEARLKRHSVAWPTTERCQSVPAVPKPLRNKARARAQAASLKHLRNRSGGYVNPALSDSIEDPGRSPRQELDVPAAMQSLYTLIKCSQPENFKQNHSTPTGPERTPPAYQQNNFSVSSIGSYHTATEMSHVRTSRPSPENRTSLLRASHRSLDALDSRLEEREEPPVVKFSAFRRVEGRELAVEAVQLLLLLLPPPKRRKLTLLLSFMDVLAAKSSLILDPKQPNRIIVVQSFMNCVLSPSSSEKPTTEDDEVERLFKPDGDLVRRVVTLMLEQSDSVLSVPADLRSEVQQHMSQFQQDQLRREQAALQDKLRRVERQLNESLMAVENRPPNELSLPLPRPPTLQYPPGPPKPPRAQSTATLPLRNNKITLPRPVSYCTQVSRQEFENHKFTSSRRALAELLEQLVDDKKMAIKEKKKKLTMFKDSYPHIYAQRFPTLAEEEKVFNVPTKPKGLFSRLKHLRI